MNSNTVRKPRIFTIGHSDRSLDQFLRILEKSSIRLVIDVRSNPASSRFPHFERAALASELEKRGLVYRWFRGLGGQRKTNPLGSRHTALSEEWQRNYAEAMNTDDFKGRVEELFGLAASTVAVILCSERDPIHCHRRFLSDKLSIAGADLVHIIDEQTVTAHDVHPDLVAADGIMLYQRKQLDLIQS